MKTTEMTVRRALAIIDLFDNLPEGAVDWTDGDTKKMTEIGGEGWRATVWPELWARYKDGRLHEQTIDLASNLDLESISKKARKEIEDGIAKINQR